MNNFRPSPKTASNPFATVELFLEHNRFVRRHSSASLRGYRVSAERYARWCEAHQVDLLRATPEQLTAYLTELARCNYSNGTLALRLSHLRCLYRWAVTTRRIRHNPTDLVDARYESRRNPRAPSIEEMEATCRDCDTSTRWGLRDLAIIELAWLCGLRISEICALELRHIQFSAGLVHVEHGKGDKERHVPLSPRMEATLRAYLERARPAFAPAPGCRHLILNQYGRPLREYNASRIIARHAESAGVQSSHETPFGRNVRALTAHPCRHGFADHLHGARVPDREIADLMGHSSVQTTQRYIKTSPLRLATAISAHPALASSALHPLPPPRFPSAPAAIPAFDIEEEDFPALALGVRDAA